MRILNVADLHTGSIKDIIYVYNVITDVFNKEVKNNKIDLIVFLGDYFHRLFKTNEEFVSLAINIMSYLVNLCKDRDIKIRIIYGTESHEMSQYHIFNHHLSSDDVDVKIITTVTEEVINGEKILYIPEEYIEDKHEYYKNYLYSGKRYNYIFGHGVISEGMPMLQYDRGAKSNEKKIPHFNSHELSDISDICLFGHYHTFTDLGDNCYYLGSFFRDSFGEEEAKGYGIIDDGVFKFIENTQAYIFKTYTFDHGDDVYNERTLLRKIQEIRIENKELYSGNKIGKLRLIFNPPSDIMSTFKESLRGLLLNDNIITTTVREDADAMEEIKEEMEEEYDYILDNSLPIADKIHRYLNKQYGEDTLSISEINGYLKDILKI